MLKLQFRQSGGFAGLLRGVDLDLARLDPADAARLRALVADAGLLERGAPPGTTAATRPVTPATTATPPAPNVAPSPLPGTARDLRNYQLRLDFGGHHAEFTIAEGQVPPRLVPLLDFLRARSMPQRD